MKSVGDSVSSVQQYNSIVLNKQLVTVSNPKNAYHSHTLIVGHHVRYRVSDQYLPDRHQELPELTYGLLLGSITQKFEGNDFFPLCERNIHSRCHECPMGVGQEKTLEES
jgi:hypothetical protein